MKTLIYALGGGLGHVTRAYKISQILTTKFPKNQCFVIASYQNLPSFLTKNLHFLWVYPHDSVLERISNYIHQIQPDVWVTDVFPNGLFYELPSILEKFSFYKIVTVRIMKPEICNLFSEIDYDESWQVEWLPEYMNNYIQALAKLHYEVRLPILQNSNAIIENQKLIIHAGSEQELNFLKCKHPDYEVFSYLDNYPLPYFKDCHLVTAAGCNILQDLFYIEKNHYIYPQNRKFDAQSIRAQNYKLLKKWLLSF